MILRMLALVAAGLLLSSKALATDITQIIAENIKGTKILNVSIVSIPHDDGMMLVVDTSAGQKKFIVSKENIVTALAMLQNPEAYGANNAILLNRTIPHLPSARPLVAQAKSPVAAPSTTTPVTPAIAAPVVTAATTPTPVITQQLIQTAPPASNASAIVSSMVLSANQQASK
jgi:hypothetical protein